MKRFLVLLGVVAVAAVPVIHSQAPAAAPVAPARQLLETLRENNAKLIEQQTKTLQLLEEMEKTSQMIKALGKRG
jgi:hypothetical protein